MANSDPPKKTITCEITSETLEQQHSDMVLADYDMSDDEMTKFFDLDPSSSSRTLQQEQQDNLVISENENDSYYLTNLLEIPNYLVASNTNKIFENLFQERIHHSASSINVEELRQIALLMHYLYILDFEKSLWNHYLKSGTGLLATNDYDLKVWPTEVKTMIQLAQRATTISDLNQMNVDDNRCFRFVHEQLGEFNKKQQKLRQELIRKKKQFYNYRDTTDSVLQTFIQEQIRSLRLQYEYKMKLVDFDYREQAVEYVLRQHPNEQQKQSIRCLFDRKYDYEKAKQEVLSMKEQTKSNKIPKVLSSIQISIPSSIESLTDVNLRLQLSDCHHRVIRQYQNDMTTILMDILETKLHESQKLFDGEITKIWQNQRTLPSHQRLDQTMLDLIDRHLFVLTEKVQCVHQYKNATDVQ